MGRHADYSGIFDIVATKPIDSARSVAANQLETTLRLVEPFIPEPDNGQDFSTRASSRDAVLRMRATRPGAEVVAMLSLPEGVGPGSRVLAFIGLSSGFGVWADLNYQSVFVLEKDQYRNLGLYPQNAALTADRLRAEALRGSRLPRDTDPSCDPAPIAVVDGGQQRGPDGGIL